MAYHITKFFQKNIFYTAGTRTVRHFNNATGPKTIHIFKNVNKQQILFFYKKTLDKLSLKWYN